jgi:hypothetical protein
MVAVIKGDIINSRKAKSPRKWLSPLKKLLGKWGAAPKTWELAWGDFFQLEINPDYALSAAFEIKALIKSIKSSKNDEKISAIDVRMAIGVGEKNYSGKRVSESNGQAFILSGEKFDILKKEKITLAIRTPWEEFNDEINLYLKLAGVFMNTWTIPSAELVKTVLQHPDATQQEIGEILNIKQNSISGRWRRANVNAIMEIDRMYRSKLSKLML